MLQQLLKLYAPTNSSLSCRWITYTLLASLFEGGGCANAQTEGVLLAYAYYVGHSLSQKSKIFASSLREGAKAASPQGFLSN